MQDILDNYSAKSFSANKRSVGTGSAMTRSLVFLVGRCEEGAEKLDEATLVRAEMEIESGGTLLSR